MKRKIIITAVLTASLALTASLLLAGCSAAGSKTAVFSSEEEINPAVSVETAAAMDAEGEAAESGAARMLSAAPSTQSRKLIRNVSIDAETTEFDSLTAELSGRVSSLDGYIESSEISGSNLGGSGSSLRSAYIKARIPSGQLDAFVDGVEETCNITRRSEETTDITLQYSDTENRKKSLEKEQARLWELLEQAESLDAVIALESRLSEISYQLESYGSQLLLYDNQVDYSTAELYIQEVNTLSPASPDGVAARIGKGFSRSVSGLAEGGLSLFVWILSNSPYLLLLAVLLFAGRKVFKRIRGPKDHKPS